jgi:hypothetical protein
VLLRQIERGRCTPILGPAVTYPALPLRSEIARSWAARYEYPFADQDDLTRVAEYVALKYDQMFPKEELVRQYLSGAMPPDFTQPGELHGLLADLPLPVYITTNYDDFMERALESRGKMPRRELCRWNKLIDVESQSDADPGYRPTPEEPLVYHLYGHLSVPQSLVLSEGDYWAFLVNISRDRDYVIPSEVARALASTSLLFAGVDAMDTSWRALFYGLVQSFESSLRRISVMVQVPPDAETLQRDPRMVADYLTGYYERFDLRVYWGTVREFAAELHARLKGFADAR